MDITARQNTIIKYMQKNETKQEWNRFLFIISLGIVLHGIACIHSPKKLNTLDYVGIPTYIWTLKRAHTLNKKEEKGHQLWHKLQQLSAQRA